MKDLKEALINKNNIKNISVRKNNKFGITEKDLTGDLEGFTLGIVVRMLEEQEKQGNKPDIEVFKDNVSCGCEDKGFNWDESEDGHNFWFNVINKNFNIFYKKHPEYKKYDRQ